jgi:hypothetical protein
MRHHSPMRYGDWANEGKRSFLCLSHIIFPVGVNYWVTWLGHSHCFRLPVVGGTEILLASESSRQPCGKAPACSAIRLSGIFD